MSQYIEPFLEKSRGKSAADAPHIFVVAHGIFNSEFLGGLLARRPPSVNNVVWKGSGMTNTGWTRLEVGYADEFPEQQGEEQSVGTGTAKPSLGDAEEDSAGRDTTQPTSVPAQAPSLTRTTTGASTRSTASTQSAKDKKPLPHLRVNIIATNVTTHLDAVKRQRGGIGSAAHDDKQKDIRSFFAGGN